MTTVGTPVGYSKEELILLFPWRSPPASRRCSKYLPEGEWQSWVLDVITTFWPCLRHLYVLENSRSPSCLSFKQGGVLVRRLKTEPSSILYHYVFMHLSSLNAIWMLLTCPSNLDVLTNQWRHQKTFGRYKLKDVRLIYKVMWAEQCYNWDRTSVWTATLITLFPMLYSLPASILSSWRIPGLLCCSPEVRSTDIIIPASWTHPHVCWLGSSPSCILYVP